MIRSIIVEDELHSMNYLKSLINDYIEDVEVIGEAETVSQALKIIKKNKPDLLFLDIQLAGESGFTILEKLGTLNFDVIFITAFQEYAIKAFKYSAVSYILKPVDIEELNRALDQVRNKHGNSDLNKRIDYLASIIKQKDSAPSRLALPVHDGYTIISMYDIIRIEADGSYSIIYMINKEKIMVSKNISAIEELLNDNTFIRIHKSYIINMNFLKRFIKNNGNSYVIMLDESTVDVSIRRKKELIDRLNKLKY